MLTVRAQGAGEPETVHRLVAAILSAPEFRSGMSVLIDAFGTGYVPEAQDAIAFPAIFEARLPGSRLAALVRPGGARSSIACVVETVATRRAVPFAVFSDRGEAMQWLTAQS